MPECKYGLLFVGLREGNVAIFKHQTPANESINEWIQLKTLTLSVDPAPCLCVTPAKERNEIWMSCGRNLRVFNIADGLLDPTIIPVLSDAVLLGNKNVAGLCYSNGYIWCFVDGSHHIERYDAATKAMVDTFYCGVILQQSGASLDLQSVMAGTMLESRTSSLTGSDNSQVAVLAPNPRAQVTAILIVEDTIWITRDTGDILVMNIKNEGRCQFGEVLAVLKANQILGITTGPSTQLFRLGCDRIVECQIIDNFEEPFRHHLLMWEYWGSQNIQEVSGLTVLS